MAVNPQQRLVLTLVASGAVGLIASFGVTRGVVGLFELPEDAQLADLSGAAVEPAGPRQPDAAEPGPDDGPPPLDAPPNGEDGPDEPLKRPPSGRARADWVDPIVGRNIFDSSKVGQAAETGETVAEGGRRSDLKVVLLATLVAIPEEYSSALIAEEEKDGATQGYGLGDQLMGEATILRIEQKKVYLKRNDGTVEFISMDDGKTKTEEPARARGERETEKEVEGVTSTGDNKFVVDRSLVEQALENPEGLARQVRVSPHKGPDGEIDGYRLSGIRRNSLMDKLGIKNGDIVHSVNGKELTSTSAAMDAYSSMSSSSSFSFDITRRNKRQSMEYEIR